MKLSISRAVVGIVALSGGLTGCGDQHPAYSLGIKYGLRQDPVFEANEKKKLGADRFDPDRPGIMPIMRLHDILKPDHPYHANSKVIDDKVFRDPANIPEKQRQELEALLETMFGTPANPLVNATEAGLDPGLVEELKLKSATLAMGSTRYRVHCLHCHGVTGDGRGPTARWINPHPRDFRAGMFKFQSVDRNDKTDRPAARSDLLRTLRHGIEGTAMPTFNLLNDDELEALISYVIHLSLRGRVEATVMRADFEPNPKDNDNLKLADAPEGGPANLKEDVKFYTAKFAKSWRESNNPASAIKVAPYDKFYDEKAANYLTEILPGSVQRGHDIFTGAPSNKSKAYFREHAFAEFHEKEVKVAFAAAIAVEEAKVFAAKEPEALKSAKAKSAEAKAIADAQAVAAKNKEKLSAADLAKIKEEVMDKVREDLRSEIKETLKNDHAKFEAAVKKDPMVKERAEAEVEKKAIAVLGGAKCSATCHIDYGRQAKYDFDNWGTLTRPNNLTQGVFRGGRRPIDIYYRIHSGIPGCEMTPFGKTFEGHERYLWDVVNFVTVLPDPLMRRSLGIKID